MYIMGEKLDLIKILLKFVKTAYLFNNFQNDCRSKSFKNDLSRIFDNLNKTKPKKNIIFPSKGNEKPYEYTPKITYGI